MISKRILAAAAAVVTSLAATGVTQPAFAAAGGHGPRPETGRNLPRKLSSASGAAAWGDNSAGQLGDGTVTRSGAPAGVGNLTGVRAIAAGDRFTLALLANGTVEGWGLNSDGQLGNGTTTSADVPVPVRGLTGVRAIAAGGAHGLALLANGTVEAWGDNIDGQLGNGTTTSSDVPVPVQGLTGVRAIAAGSLHSLALLPGGTVKAWGSNQDGQLGNGTLANSQVPLTVPGLSGVTAISAGGLFSVALLGGGTAEAWGQGDEGELGNGNTTASETPVRVQGLTGATAISAGDEHTLALLSDGTVMAWGANNFGQLGNPGTPLGPPDSDVPVPVQGLKGPVTAVSAGGQSSLALLKDGAVRAWGDNAFGQLGNGTTSQSTTPVAVTGLTGVTAVAAGSDYAAAVVPAPGPVVTGSPESIFHTVATPSPGVKPIPASPVDDSFASVSAATTSDALAVGTSTRGINQTPLAEHWNGTAWRATAVPAPKGRMATIRGVVDLGHGDGWAVGSTTGGSTGSRTLIEHWNGSAWTIVPSPDPLGGTEGNDQLAAVDGVSATDVWAVGDKFSGNGGGITLLFEHFNGTTWTAFPFPASAGFQLANAITTISPTDAWVVGSEGLAKTLAAHFDGTRWSLVRTPSPMDGPNPTNELTGVTAISASNAYASGFEANVNSQNFDKPYVLHWNGKTWSLVTLPNAGTEGSRLNAITSLSASDVWAVGATLESDGAELTLAEHFNGTTWAITPTPDPGQDGPLAANGLQAAATPMHGIVWALGGQQTLGECCQQTLGLETSQG